MLKLQVVAMLLTASTLVSPHRQRAIATTPIGSKPPIVSATDAPAGAERFAVQWFRVAVPSHGAMLAAVARPSGAGPVPAVILLHGTHGFAQQYVEWIQDLARAGFVAVAGCWFSGGGGPGANAVTPPITCPQMPPLGPGEYLEGLRYIDALVQATRALPGVRSDRVALAGHSRGAGATLQYLLANGNVQAAILHSSGYALNPGKRAAEFNVPILIMHGTADGPAGGGSTNTHIALARDFEMALRRNRKSVEANYYEGGRHNSFFSNPTQRDDELQLMVQFLRRYLGR